MEAIQILVEFGGEIDAINDEGQTPLCVAVESNNISCITTLISSGADVNRWCVELGETPLHIAALHGHSEAVQLLSEFGADPNARNDAGLTPLCFAIETNKLHVVKPLIDAGAEVNSLCGLWGETVLHVAVSKQNVDAVLSLIEFGANIDAENNAGMTPLHLAVMKNNLNIIDILVSKGVNLNKKFGFLNDTVLHFAIARAKFKTIEKLFGLGADVNLKDRNGETPLHIAVKEGKVEVLELLFSVNDDKINLRDNNNWSLLHWGAFCGQESTCSWLLKKGADVQAKDNDGQIPLHLAAKEGHTNIVKLFLEWGKN